MWKLFGKSKSVFRMTRAPSRNYRLLTWIRYPYKTYIGNYSWSDLSLCMFVFSNNLSASPRRMRRKNAFLFHSKIRFYTISFILLYNNTKEVNYLNKTTTKNCTNKKHKKQIVPWCKYLPFDLNLGIACCLRQYFYISRTV